MVLVISGCCAFYCIIRSHAGIQPDFSLDGLFNAIGVHLFQLGYLLVKLPLLFEAEVVYTHFQIKIDVITGHSATEEHIGSKGSHREIEDNTDGQGYYSGPVAPSVTLEIFQTQFGLKSKEPAGQPRCPHLFPSKLNIFSLANGING